jgi:hypothetical protein
MVPYAHVTLPFPIRSAGGYREDLAVRALERVNLIDLGRREEEGTQITSTVASPSKGGRDGRWRPEPLSYFAKCKDKKICSCGVLLPSRTLVTRSYNPNMARGWESKSIEAQQDEAREKSSKPARKLTPEQAAQEREKEGLRLSRKRIVEQLARAQNARHKKMLQDALDELDARSRNL